MILLMFLILWKITQQVVSQFVLNTKRISTQPSYPQEFFSVRFGLTVLKNGSVRFDSVRNFFEPVRFDFTKTRTDPITASDIYDSPTARDTELQFASFCSLIKNVSVLKFLRLYVELLQMAGSTLKAPESLMTTSICSRLQ
jgi:hypothetical protein